MDENTYLNQVASLANFHHYPRQGPWERKSGCAIGVRDGYVAVVGLTRSQKQAKVVILLRFKKMEQPEMLKAAVTQSETLTKMKRGKLAATGSDFLRWEWKYSFAKPKAEDVVQLTNALRETIKSVVAGFEGRCEKCQRTSTPELTLMNGLPLYICAGCQDATRQEQDQATTNYEALQPNYPNGAALGIGAAIVGGVGWGLGAYALHYVFLYGAILIGYFVSWGMIKGTGKVTRLGQISIPILTIASILFGDAIFFTLTIMKERDLSFSLDLLKAVIVNLWSIEGSGNGAASIIFALIGAGYALYRARKPKFKAVFEPLGTPGT
jgi:hypothetical protein